MTSSQYSVTNAENKDLTSEACSECGICTVSHELDYGMDLPNFILGKHSLDLLHIGCEAKAASMGVPSNGTGQEVPVQ